MKIRIYVNMPSAFRRGFAVGRSVVIELTNEDVSALPPEDRDLIADRLVELNQMMGAEADAEIAVRGISEPTLAGVISAIKAQVERESEAKKEIQRWIDENGSDVLKKCYDLGIEYDELYLLERLELECPGWVFERDVRPEDGGPMEEMIWTLDFVRNHEDRNATLIDFDDSGEMWVVSSRFHGKRIYYSRSSNDN